MTNYFLKAIDELSDEKTLVVEGYLMLFGGEDLTGENFVPDTDYDSDYVKNNILAIDLEHGLMPDDEGDGVGLGRDDILGKVDALTIRKDDIGVLARRMLNRQNRYVKELVEPLLRAGKLGSSTEATRSARKSKDGTILKWPLMRDSLTVTPAEPRLLTDAQLQIVKSLTDKFPHLKSLLLPQGEEENAGDDDGIQGDEMKTNNNNNNDTNQEINEMDKEALQEVFAPVVEALNANTETVKAFIAKQEESAKLQKSAGGTNVQVISDEEDKRPWKGSLSELLTAVKSAPQSRELAPLRTDEAGVIDFSKAYPTLVGRPPQVEKIYGKAPTGLSEMVPADGGLLVGTDNDTTIMGRMYNTSEILSRVNMTPIGNTSNSMAFYREKENSRVNGSRRGGIRGYWKDEASALTASKPQFEKMRLELEKMIVAAYATDELLADTVALNAWILQALPEELRFMAEDAVINGTGVGQPEGILNSASLVSVAKETGQSASTIVAENISKAWARRWLGGRNYVWLHNQDIEPQLDKLSYAVGTGGALVYMPPGGLADNQFGRIKGRPVIPVEYCPTLGTLGDLLLVDLSTYKMIDKGGIQGASSIHVQFLQDETVFKFTYRVDGMPEWNTPLTPYKGTNTVSPYVAIATRA